MNLWSIQRTIFTTKNDLSQVATETLRKSIFLMVNSLEKVWEI